MRTTLTIDDDLMALLRKRAKQLDLSFRDMVNQALRAGLGEAARKPAEKIVVAPLELGPVNAGIDLDKLNQWADELEDEAVVGGMRRRR